MTYNERVEDIAERIAKVMHPLKTQSGFTYEQLAKHYSPAARIAVKHMASEVSAHIKWNARSEMDIENYLKEHGLIPNEKEVNNDIQRTRTGHCGKDGVKRKPWNIQDEG